MADKPSAASDTSADVNVKRIVGELSDMGVKLSPSQLSKIQSASESLREELQQKGLKGFKKGTKSVPKTGVYKLHKGEKVVPSKRVARRK